MIVKTLIVSVMLIAIVMLALGIKMLFDKNAKFEVHSCSFNSEEDREQGTCSSQKINEKNDQSPPSKTIHE